MTARGRVAGRYSQQDQVTTEVWGERTDVDGAGSVLSVRTTRGDDEELPVVNFGYSFNVAADTDTEVMTLNLGADPNAKVAIPILPLSSQRQWPVGTGGVQHPTDAGRYIEFNGDETHLSDGTFVVGSNREVTITVDGSNVTISTGGNMTLQAQAVEITSNTLTHNGQDIGENHTHSGVDTGVGTTGAPNS